MRRGKKRKGIKPQRAKHPTPSPSIDTLIDEEQNGKQKKENERNREWDTNPATLNHSITSHDPQ